MTLQYAQTRYTETRSALGNNSRSKMRLRTKKAVAAFLFLPCSFVATSDGAKICGEPLGVGRHPDRVVIPDNQMKASSEVPGYPASSGRLRDLGWAPDSLDKDPYPYLQINLVNLYLVCGFKIQGCSDFKGKPAWVTRYRVQVSPEENYWDSWNYIKPEFYGGENAKEIVYSSAEERKVGYFVRIFPMTFENAACMKVKVFGEPYITGKVPVFGLEADAVMLYVKREVEKAEDTTVTAKVDGVTIDYSFHPDYAKVIPAIKPLKTELKVDACVLVPAGKDFEKGRFFSGRVHEVKGDQYVVEQFWIAKKHSYGIHELYVVFGAWCKKIDFTARVTHLHGSNSTLCLGNIVRVDSKLVFQTRTSTNPILTRISYNIEEHRPPVSDYVSSEPVVRSEVTLGKTVLYYANDYDCSLLNGTVTDYDEQHNIFTIDGKEKKGRSDVRYSTRSGLEQCGKSEKHCHDSRIPYKVNRRKCPNLKTWNGKECIDEDECNNGFAACGLNGTCKNTPGFYKCLCPKGFENSNNINPRTEKCQDIDECKEEKCHKDANCQNTHGSFSCFCKREYTGDGRKECKPSKECLKELPNCDFTKATCHKDENDIYSCRCKPGYSENGAQRCTDINECSTDLCSKDADCFNTDGSFSCSCKTGFQGNGFNCSEVDECRNEAACAKKAKCTNTRGSYRCMCNKGYNGNPYNVCNDVDECKFMNCGYGQNCTNTPGSYDCSCAKGFRPDVKTGLCKDIDECATISSPCGTYNFLSCENKAGTYYCRCKMGYKFNIKERKCEDINECKEKSACADHAKCTNAEGSYSCICAKGYSGDGLNFCEHAHKSSTNKAVIAWNLLFATLSTVLVLVTLNTQQKRLFFYPFLTSI
ncbi:uncharacterized protein LOC144656640 [Oculina patagonica]